jgi:hypothetical protein
MRSKSVQTRTRAAYIIRSEWLPRVSLIVDKLCRCVVQRSRRRTRVPELESRDEMVEHLVWETGE